MDFQDLLSDPALLDELISRIAGEVLRRINTMPKKALVLFSGGAIGFQEALDSLSKLTEDNWEFTVFMSDAALGFLDQEKIKKALKVDKIYHSGVEHNPKLLLQDIDRVIIAEMTINTCSKIAYAISDNELLDQVKNALLMGIPITAAVDGACPDNKVRAQMGMNKENKRYHDLLHDHLVMLAGYGIWLCNAEDLYEAVTKKTDRKEKAKDPVGSGSGKRLEKHVISRRDILDNRNSNPVMIPADSLLTHSASDLADELGIQIVRV